MSDSSIARVLNVLFSPARTFAAIRERPTWLVALVVLVLLGTVAGYLVGQRLDWEEVARAQVEQSSRQLSEEQIEQSISLVETLGPVMMIAGPLVFAPAVYLILALLFWVVLKLLGSDFPYKTSFATTLHGMMPSAVSALLAIPVVLGRGELDYEQVQTGSVLTSSLAALAPEGASNAMLALLSSVDVFSIWNAVLLSLGYSIVGRVSRGKAAAMVVGLWLVYIVVKVGLAAIRG